MNPLIFKKPVLVGAVAIFAFASTGCATKNFVRGEVDPVNTRIGEVEQKTNENATALNELDERVQNDVSRLDEQTKSAMQVANDATDQAKQAGQHAQQAQSRADEAHTLAANGVLRLENLQKSINNFQLAAEDTVNFGFDRAVLTPEGKQALDQLMSQAAANQHFVIEVEGYTDNTGAENYNLELSRKRAAAVVRYLVANHNVPLRNIHTIGMGKAPIEEGQRATREIRQQNRRVDVRIYVPTLEGEQQQAGGRTGT
jgi:OmpA-OmpF porin, OOP family